MYKLKDILKQITVMRATEHCENYRVAAEQITDFNGRAVLGTASNLRLAIMPSESQ
jgi:hypothetical protein